MFNNHSQAHSTEKCNKLTSTDTIIVNTSDQPCDCQMALIWRLAYFVDLGLKITKCNVGLLRSTAVC